MERKIIILMLIILIIIGFSRCNGWHDNGQKAYNSNDNVIIEIKNSKKVHM